MTLDDLIAELETAREWRGGSAAISERAELAFRGAGLLGGGAAMPALPDPPAAGRLPTSREYAAKLTPAVRQAMREAKPGGLGGFLVRIMPILKQIVEIVLMLAPLFAMAQAKSGTMQAPGGGWLFPYRDEPEDIPADIQRAARMEG